MEGVKRETATRDGDCDDRDDSGIARRLSTALAPPGVGAAAFCLAFVLAAAVASLGGNLVIPAVALLVSIVVLMLAATRVNLAIGLYAFVIFIEASQVVGDSTGVYLLAEVFVGVVLLAVLGNRAELFKTPSALGWLLIVSTPFVVMLLSSFFWAPEPDSVVLGILMVIRLIAISCVVVFAVRRFDAMRGVMWGLIAGGVFLAGIGLVQVITGNFEFTFFGFGVASSELLGVASESVNRLTGPIGDANFFGQRLVVVVPLAIERLVNERRTWLRCLSAACGTIVVLAAIFTYSRGAALAMLAVALLALVHFLKPVVAAIVLASGLAVVLVVMPPTFVERITAISQVTDHAAATDTSVKGRTSEALVAVNMFKDRTFFGVGTAQYPHLYADYATEVGLDKRSMRAPHSLYLQFAAEGGIVGLAMFGLVIAGCILTVRAARRRLRGLGLRREADMLWAVRLALYGHLIAAVFLHFGHQRVFFVLIALCLAGWSVVGSVDRSAIRPGGVPPLGGLAT